ncbi:MAG: aldo/keto reductase [Alphaproteobacteria bacterium]|nr:aldo/keto reductase [Alphaproteobacteria bacterium]
MEYRNLGRSGLAVSKLCLGTMLFGRETDVATADKIVGSARDAGVNFIDTANGYAGGDSERTVGKLIAKDRDDWVLATKGGGVRGPGPFDRGISRKALIKFLDDSLQRLGTDYIDLYYLHKDDEHRPLEETVATLGDMIRAGKIRHWGISNFRGWRHVEAVRVADALGVERPVASQPYYNAMNRMPETEILPACAHHGIGVVPYSPLARGVLTGKYAPGESPDTSSRAGRGDKRILETEFRDESIAMAQTIKTHAEARGMTAGDFALRWVLNNKIITSVLAGPRTMAHWESYLAALSHDFTSEDEALIDELVTSGHPSTPRYNDPQYDILGRPTYSPA